MTEAELPTASDFQHAVIDGGMLQTYTSQGWQFVRLIDVPGTEMLQKVDTIPGAGGSSGYQPPPNTHINNSGNFVRWSAVAALVRRPVQYIDHESQLAQLRVQIAESEVQRKELNNALGTAVSKCDLAIKNQNELSKTVDSWEERFKQSVDANIELKKQLATVEQDVGKREMDRILGRFPAPIDLITVPE